LPSSPLSILLAVAKDERSSRAFWKWRPELGVAALSFFVGLIVRNVFGVEI
jgi:hypothetical protein